MKINKDIQACPSCGCTTYYIKQRITGNLRYRVNFDGTEANNAEMYESTTCENTSDFAWCDECNKKLFRLHD